MTWGAVAIVGSSLISGYMSSQAAGKAANQQRQAANASLALQQQQHDQTVANLAPYNTAGTNALSTMDQLNGGNFSSFTQSPDYQFALQQGTKAMDASAAARGNLFSGGYGQQMQQYGQGLATQNYNNYYNHLSGVAGLGENAAAMTGNANTAYANAGTNTNMAAGQAQAAGTINSSNAWSNALNQISSSGGQYGSSYGSQPTQYANPTLNSGMGGYQQYQPINSNMSTYSLGTAGTGVGS